MNIQFLGKTARYALAATTALAALPPGQRLSSVDLAARTQIPPAFLSKVLGRLARAGIADGAKGHHGGYRLARDPSQIVLFDVVEAVHEDDDVATPCVLGAPRCSDEYPCALHVRWTAMRQKLLALLHEVTVAEAATAEHQPWAAGLHD